MSGVYIKGMEIPKNGMPIKAFIYPDGSVRVKLQGGGFLGLRAIPVPPHGRLIDADEYRDEFMNGVYAECYDDPDNIRANSIIDIFDSAPTIIPAEEDQI